MGCFQPSRCRSVFPVVNKVREGSFTLPKHGIRVKLVWLGGTSAAQLVRTTTGQRELWLTVLQREEITCSKGQGYVEPSSINMVEMGESD